ncbi:MAG: UDP-N-acetylglucosamine 2-epimerase (non-hydrolyzing) [Bacteroidota bacterium]
MSQTISWLSIVGARPQFIKLAPLVRSIQAYNASHNDQIEHIIVHTGQHYDSGLSDVFFEELQIPAPDHHLGVGSGSHGAQTAKMLSSIEEILLANKPDMMIVFGDTNSTLAGAIAATKLHVPIAHIEAGLRSFNRKMPEEINRVLTDHASDLLLVPTETAIKHLASEGLSDRTIPTGDIMYDTVLQNSQIAGETSQVLQTLDLEPHQYGLVTMHRPANTDNPDRLLAILQTLNRVADEEFPLVLPLHPRTKARLASFDLDWTASPNFRFVEPLGYLDMMQMLSNARIALTDSGGLQKEAFFLNTPCITMRDETEWDDTISAGANVLTGASPDLIWQEVQKWQERLKDGRPDFASAAREAFGDGNAADQIRDAILAWMKK